ncbi:MAG TPA: ThuA domain-containing protein [Bryobacteraceae bacterium]|nr:ThuA domain-containing protein [Bryobacteraceae bacterium]
MGQKQARLTLLAAALAAAAFAQSTPIKLLVVTGDSDGQYHDWRATTGAIQEILARTGRFETRVVEAPRGLAAAALQGYDAIAINYNGPRLGVQAEHAIEQFVRNGGGLFAFHLCSYGEWFGMEFKDGKWQSGPTPGWPEYPKMIGMNWAPEMIGHARRWTFLAEWKDPAHPIAQGLAKQWMANDELYHKFDLMPDSHVVADAFSPPEIGGTSRREPLAWVKPYGKGRVFYTTLGHDAMAFYQPGMRDLIARGIEWASTGRVTIPAIDWHRADRGADPVRVLAVTGGHGYPAEFYQMLNSLKGVSWIHAATEQDAFSRPLEDRFDVVILHDMRETTAEIARTRLKAFVEAGKGVISLHHAIVDYTDWPWWYREVIGGKYFTKATPEHAASSYKEDLDFLVAPVQGKRHPVLTGVGPLYVNDELYKGMWHSDKIDVLMTTSHPANDAPVVYAGPNPAFKALHIQVGHSAHTFNHPGFQKLMSNAVQWAAGRIK